MNAREEAFETELLAFCALWDKKGIETKNILRGIEDYSGAVATAAWYVMHDSEGLRLAVERLGCGYTIESLVVDERFIALFDAEVAARAREKLEVAGC
jgi:hypothetical protein